MLVVTCVFCAIVLRVLKTFETSKTNSLILAEKGHYVEGKALVSVIVNDELNGLVVDCQINAVHEVPLKKEERSGNLAMPLSPPSRQPF